MRIGSAFPSDYLKAADLQGRSVTVTMDRVEMRDIGDDHKPVLYFQGKEKGMVLNKTNSNNISAAYGDETQEWAGQPIELFPTMVDFQGKSVEAIRCRIPRGNGAQRHAYAPPAHPVGSRMEPGERAPQNGGGGRPTDLNDDIPFSPDR